MLKPVDRMPETEKFAQKRRFGRRFRAVLGRNRNNFRQRAGPKSFFSSLLSRDDLRYILDLTDVMGTDYPSETFRVLRDKEIRQHGEYRTHRCHILEIGNDSFRLKASSAAASAAKKKKEINPALTST